MNLHINKLKTIYKEVKSHEFLRRSLIMGVLIASGLPIAISLFFIKDKPPIDVIPPVYSGEVLPPNPDIPPVVDKQEDFLRMKRAGNYIEYFPTQQPLLNSDYEQNTARMVSYMKENSFRITLNSPIKEGYLYIRIKTNPDNKDNQGKLFFYIARDNTSGYIDISSADYSQKNSNDGTYDILFNIKKIKFFPYKGEGNSIELNLIKRLSFFQRTDYISTFWVNNKSDSIEQITFAYAN